MNEPFWREHYDDGVSFQLPPLEPLPTTLRRVAERQPRSTAIVFLGSRISYRRLWNEARRFAGALAASGVEPGDRVALMLPNSPQFVVAFYGALLAGATVVNVNPMYTARELAHQLGDSGARALVLLDLLWPRFEEIQDEFALKAVVRTGIQDYLPFPKNRLFPLKARREGTWPERLGGTPWKAFLRNGRESAPPPREPRLDDLALLQYTGGTTGTPKGAMLTHRNLASNAHQVKAWIPDFREGGEVILGVIPFFHVYGMTVAMNLAVVGGARLVLLPRWDTKLTLETIQRERPTLFPGVPTMYVAINTSPLTPRYRLGSIRACISGSAPLPVEVAQTFEKITGAKLVEGYGLTESSPVTHANPIYGRRKKGAIGLPLPGVEARIVDPDGQPLPPGEVGELVVKGPNVMKGYWNRPEETAQTLKDGWLFTGDVARMDEEGYFYIVDRKKDMIIAGGYNIYPREVEEVLYQHPAVKEAAVVGVPDAYRGETVKAFVVLKEGYEGQVSEEELKQFAKERLAAYKVPKLWEFRDDLPKTAVGKILRRMLK
ncbi:AMP-dependent synthetase and ligase [Oceanithermus profundus DSM 14977]|uniref:AMP-dependent synthetase and ligase n=1 Tax=Oceanithermus profundus (strain DSM 14977 / NBRC 100410 / VKM B-2274 / 506) TaxID=670487 RepID=E4U7E0_OCEP5|nr:long-chain fatty acid--CoA ligase [Oceanithermus profundus]ADR36389.1 AMP-dependent synthetase and ligase [Oceanithermus profundus DSM 14977]